LLLVLSGGSGPFSIQTPASVFFCCSVFFLFSHFCFFFCYFLFVSSVFLFPVSFFLFPFSVFFSLFVSVFNYLIPSPKIFPALCSSQNVPPSLSVVRPLKNSLFVPPDFSPPFARPVERGIYRTGETGATLPLSNHGDRVGWLGRPLYSRLVWLLCPIFIMVAGKGCGLCKSLGKWGEREWHCRGKKLLLSLPLRVQGKKENSVVQNDTVWFFFFNA
jgi:hypothetical protein